MNESYRCFPNDGFSLRLKFIRIEGADFERDKMRFFISTSVDDKNSICVLYVCKLKFYIWAGRSEHKTQY